MSGIILGGLILLVFAYAFSARSLATSKKYWTSPKEGTLEFIMAGGEVVDAICVWKGKTIRMLNNNTIENDDADGEEISVMVSDFDIVNEEDVLEKSLFHHLNPLNWFELLGIYWVGVYPFLSIYAYNFDWTEEVIKADGSVEIRVRHAREGAEGKTTFIKLVATPYVFTLAEVKTSESIPLKIVVVVTVRVVNPYKALFRQNDWLKSTQGAINGTSIAYCGNKKYAVLTADKGGFATALKRLGDKDPSNQVGIDLLDKSGIEIDDVQIRTIEFADAEAEKKYQELATRAYEAEREAEALLIKTEAEAKAIVTLATADATAVSKAAEAERGRIEKIYTPIAGDDKDKRMQIRQIEGLEKAGANGGTTVIASNEAFGLVTATLQGAKK